MAMHADRRYIALRQNVSRLFTLVAALLMGVSAYLFRWEQPHHPLLEATLLMLLGGLSLCFALLIRPATVRSSSPSIPPDQSRGFNIWLFLPGLLAFLLLIENNSGLLHIDLLAHLTLGQQLVLFVVGILFITAAFAGFRFSRPRRQGRLSFRALVPGLLLLLITLLAFAVRDWQLGTSVRRLIDEINFAHAIVGLRLSNQDLKLLAPFSGITAFPWLFPYVQSVFVTLGGRNLESMRFFSVLLGTLGVPALYLLAKTLFDRRTALLAALLLATFPPHIQFSRIALNNIADPLFGTLMLAFLARALKNGRRADYALAGTMLGLTQYFYEGGRFLYPALALLWIAWHILLKRFQPAVPLLAPVRTAAKTEPSLRPVPPAHYSPRRAGLSTFFLSAVVISLPLYITLLSLHQSLSQRFEIVGLGGSYWLRVQQVGTLQTPEEQFLGPLLVYVHLPEIGQYYGGEQGMLLPEVVLFFFFGGFVLLWRWRSPGFMLVLWVLLTSAGNVLLTDSAIYARYVVVFPALVLIAVVGIRSLPALLFASRPRPSRPRFRLSFRVHYPVISTLLALFLAALQVAYFFGPHLQTYNRQIRPFADAEDAVFRGAALPYGTVVHVISLFAPPSNYLSTLMLYLADGIPIESLAPDKVSRPYLASLPPDHGHAFFIQPDDISTLAYLRQSFKDDLQGPFSSPYDVPPSKQLMLYYLPAIPLG